MVAAKAERPAAVQPTPQHEQLQDEQTPQDAAQTPAEPAVAHSAWDSRISFVYGLLIGPVIFCFGGMVFLMVGQRRDAPVAQRKFAGRPTSATADHASDRIEFDRMVTAVLAELKRRDRRPSDPPARELRAEEPGLN